jgi:hypothetical protein
VNLRIAKPAAVARNSADEDGTQHNHVGAASASAALPEQSLRGGTILHFSLNLYCTRVWMDGFFNYYLGNGEKSFRLHPCCFDPFVCGPSVHSLLKSCEWPRVAKRCPFGFERNSMWAGTADLAADRQQYGLYGVGGAKNMNHGWSHDAPFVVLVSGRTIKTEALTLGRLPVA